MKTTKDSKVISDNVSLEMESDRDGGEYLDTRVVVAGEFWVAGSQRNEFAEKMGKLIDEYRI